MPTFDKSSDLETLISVAQGGRTLALHPFYLGVGEGEGTVESAHSGFSSTLTLSWEAP